MDRSTRGRESTVSASVIIPTYNEEHFIDNCLRTIVNQDYPQRHTEIIVVDGMSTDATRSIVAQYAQRHRNIRLADNPSGSASIGLNIGVRMARGDIIVRMDGHAEAQPDHISKSVEYLLTRPCDLVGCVTETVGIGYWGQRIAVALSSPFGVGNASYRLGQREIHGEPGWLGTIRRKTLLNIGCYDESFKCNEDDELSYRMLNQEYTLYTPADISARYFCRTTLRDLWNQYFNFGFWKVAVICKCRRIPSLRHIMPALLILTAVTLAVGALFSSELLKWLIGVIAAYATFLIVGSWTATQRKRIAWFPTVIPAFLVLHLAYGAGFLAGIVERIVRQAQPRRDVKVSYLEL